jgi:hypothetical protein
VAEGARIGAVEVLEKDIDDEAGRGLEVVLSFWDDIVEMRRSHGFAMPDPLNSKREASSSNPGVDDLVDAFPVCSTFITPAPSCIPRPRSSIPLCNDCDPTSAS